MRKVEVDVLNAMRLGAKTSEEIHKLCPDHKTRKGSVSTAINHLVVTGHVCFEGITKDSKNRNISSWKLLKLDVVSNN